MVLISSRSVEAILGSKVCLNNWVVPQLGKGQKRRPLLAEMHGYLGNMFLTQLRS